MSLSVAIASLPLLFMAGTRLKLFSSSALCVFISLSLYQASLSAFIAMVCLYTIFSIKKGCSPYKVFIEDVIATFGMTAGYLLYSKIIVPIYVTSDYANNYNQMVGGFEEIKSNILITVNVLRSFFTGHIATLFILIGLIAAFGFVNLLTIIYKSNSSTGKLLTSLLLVFLSATIILLCIPGPGIALKNIPIGPRVFIGFGFAISTLLALVSFASNKYQNKLNIIYVLLALVSFSYMATFANAMRSQERLADRIIYGVMNDIINIGFNNVKTITVDGKSLYTPIASKAIQKFPLMEQIIPSYFDGPLAWGIVKMTEIYAGKEQPSPSQQVKIISELCSMRLITNAGLYKTYFNDGNLVISFSFRECK